ncbi:GNAT family N-acetyltransferase [Methylobacterium sp. WL9]|uniref:GNAT family N-acetyltransferase n=1 Tax=Methylobacterium sp. WL9 TaxID=2603898 RepID=UPI0011C99744|nr:GNAT family N-acetyltransferase [Methylobacterium sp. WL9]TXN23884.1 GNAT family N-acetyltransferase [Methylobacterium sp. WL9]
MTETGSITIRPAKSSDRDAIPAILHPIVRAGDTYALPSTWSGEAILAYWMAPAHRVLVAEMDGHALGTCYIRPNQLGGGGHVANAGYATHRDAAGRGIARALAERSFAVAREAGFTAMQFNFVVASNTRAVVLWRSLDFAEVGRLPEAFRHPSLGLVDALVMHRRL